MKNILLLGCLLAFASVAIAQSNELIGQYYLNLPAYNPAHTGTDNFLNVNLGIRRQWAGFAGAPNTSFLSGYGAIKNRKDSNPTNSGKHGLGGYVMSNRQGNYQQSEVSLMYAYHIPVAARTYLSLGMSPSYYAEQIEVDRISVEDISDAAYQSLLNQGNKFSSLQLNTGLALHADRFYLSYSLREAVRVGLSGNDDVFANKAEKRHHFMGAYAFTVNQQLSIIPNTFVRLDQHRPALVELGARARYQSNLWAGVSYRNDQTVVGSLGFLFDQRYQFGYAYEHKSFGISQYARGTHELIVGIHLFKPSKPSKPVSYDPAPVAAQATPEPEVVQEVAAAPALKSPVVQAPVPKTVDVTLQSKRGVLLTGGALSVKNLTDGTIKTVVINDGPAALALMPGNDYEISGTKEGYGVQTIKLTASDIDRRDAGTPVALVVAKDGIFENMAVGQELEMAIGYEVGKSTVKSSSIPELDKLVDLLTENPELSIELGSHSDARGSDAANLALSQKRAESAVAYLVSKGIDKDRVTAQGYGETRLKIASATTEAEHSQNRRTVIRITAD